MRGRRPKLAEIKRLEGNRSRVAIVDTGPQALGEPFVAEHLSDDAQGCIECVIKSMPLGVYSALDSFVLAAFATAWVLHRRAAHEVNNPSFEPVIVTRRGVRRPNPWLRI